MNNMTKSKPAFTLVEALVAMVILAVTALGALAYQYHAASHSKLAQSQMTAIRVAQMLLEDWKSTGGDINYDPAALGLGFSVSGEIDSDYVVTVDDLQMWIKLDKGGGPVAFDNIAEVELWQLVVSIKWKRDYSNSVPDADDPSITLTTYVRVDGAGG